VILLATLGALMSQQIGFTITTTGGTVYTHSLGTTPTIVLLTWNGTVATPAASLCYTAANSATVTISTTGAANQICDVLCGNFHSLIK
jgi:hypothetical protein